MLSSGTSSEPLLQLKGIRKTYQGHPVLRGLSFSVPDGQFLTILGASGCGKTTLLRLMAGLDYPDEGQILLAGENITHVPAERRPIHTIFQRYALFPHMSVFENVAFGLRMKRLPYEQLEPRVIEALEWVQLHRFAHRMPSELSGGQQQRVAIARAIVNRPRILLLDECLSALDQGLRKKMQEELKAMQRQLQIPFIFVTHNQEEALCLSDEIIILREGQVEQRGTPREVYEEPRNSFVAQFVGDGNLFQAQVHSVLSPTRVQAEIEGKMCELVVSGYLRARSRLTIQDLLGKSLVVLLRPEDLRIREISEGEQAQGLVGRVQERHYKGMTLDSVIELESGKLVRASEFFNEDDPDVDHSLHQRVSVTWVESWEVVLDG